MTTKHEEDLRELAELLDRALELVYSNPMGFMLVVSPFGEEGLCDYISNGAREDCIRWLRETADKLEANQLIPITKGTA